MDKSKFFFRKAVYTEAEGKAELVTDFEPTKTTPLDPWMSLVFLMADGEHTLGQLYQQLEKQYKGNIPSGFEKTVESVVNRLMESQAVGLSEKSMQLPPYISTPFNKQDQKKSLKMMLKDGYLKLEDLD